MSSSYIISETRSLWAWLWVDILPTLKFPLLQKISRFCKALSWVSRNLRLLLGHLHLLTVRLYSCKLAEVRGVWVRKGVFVNAIGHFFPLPWKAFLFIITFYVLKAGHLESWQSQNFFHPALWHPWLACLWRTSLYSSGDGFPAPLGSLPWNHVCKSVHLFHCFVFTGIFVNVVSLYSAGNTQNK